MARRDCLRGGGKARAHTDWILYAPRGSKLGLVIVFLSICLHRLLQDGFQRDLMYPARSHQKYGAVRISTLLLEFGWRAQPLGRHAIPRQLFQVFVLRTGIVFFVCNTSDLDFHRAIFSLNLLKLSASSTRPVLFRTLISSRRHRQREGGGRGTGRMSLFVSFFSMN